LRAEHGDEVAGHFIALEQLWLHDEVMRLVAFSPAVGWTAAELPGEPAIRIHHDNALSKEHGCGRTPWHYDAEHFRLATLQAVTAWIPVTAIPAYMGPLALARGAHVRDMVADLSFDKVGTTYDAAVARRLVESDVAVDASPVAVGEVSSHSALCFHTAGPNRSTQPRRALSTTYYADGARVLESPTLVSAAFWAGPVARGDEHPVDGGVGLDPDDLGRPFAVRAREHRPVDRGAQQLCAVQRGQPACTTG
jgi:ectoine hydroxylase-related dioxygenase (phytanoyl-CoA dioxygenase family)